MSFTAAKEEIAWRTRETDAICHGEAWENGGCCRRKIFGEHGKSFPRRHVTPCLSALLLSASSFALITFACVISIFYLPLFLCARVKNSKFNVPARYHVEIFHALEQRKKKTKMKYQNKISGFLQIKRIFLKEIYICVYVHIYTYIVFIYL